LRATSAGAWVMLARKPRRRVTGAELLPPDEEPEPVDAPDDEQPAARAVTAAVTPAARRTRLITNHLVYQLSMSICLIGNGD
jgi:hypothetical protein